MESLFLNGFIFKECKDWQEDQHWDDLVSLCDARYANKDEEKEHKRVHHKEEKQ